MSGRARALRGVLWLTLPTLVLLVLVLAASFWRLPTDVDLELVTRRLAVTVGGESAREILNPSVAFAELTAAHCAAVIFRPRRLRVAGPDASWRTLETDGRVRFLCSDPDARIVLRGADPRAPFAGSLDRLRVQPGTPVVLEVADEHEITVELANAVSLAIKIHGELELVTDLVELEGVDVPVAGDLLTWRAELPDTDPLLELESRPDGLVLVLKLPASGGSDLFRGQPRLPLASVEFLEQTLDGELRSPIVTAGTLRYPGFPGVSDVALPPEEFFGLDSLGTFQLEHLALDTEHDALAVRLAGRAGRVRGTRGPFAAEYRLSVLDRFRYSSRWNLLAAVAVWALSTTWVAWERWKKLR